MNKKILNLLILEDNPDDAELIVKELKKEGFIVKWNRVDTEKAFKKSLADKLDLILADYRLPKFDGMSALKLQQKLTPNIPLIIISGTIGEETAAECMKAGATDYVLKDRLSRLGPVVKRSLNEAEEHSKRKQAEETLKQIEERNRLITENTSDIITLTTFEINPIFTYISPSVKIMGYKPEDLIGKPCLDFIHPDNKKVLLSLLKEYISGKAKKLITGKGREITERIEFLLKDKSGNWHHFQSTVNIIGNQILFVSRVITEQKKSEKALRESEEKYRSLVENLEEGIATVDEKENIMLVNRAAANILGYSRKELLKMNVKDFTTPEEFQKVLKQTSLRKNDKLGQYEFNIVQKDGSLRNILMTASPIFDSQKNYTGSFGILRDITERKKWEKELLQKNEELSRFNKMAVDREIKMIELKKEINTLLKKLGEKPRYEIVE